MLRIVCCYRFRKRLGGNLKIQNMALLACFLCTGSPAAATVVSLPFPYDAAADTLSAYPFATKQVGVTSMRLQQVYGASGFSVFGFDPDGEYITQLIFDLDSPGHDVSWRIPKIEINLSTTTRDVDSLSPVFADNVGGDSLTVYGPGSLSFVTAGSLVIPLDKPFFYNPSRGNLLMDVSVFDGSGTPDLSNLALDARFAANDQVSQVYAIDVTAPTGTLSTVGLRTGFLGQPVPEATSALLFLFGSAALLALRSRNS